MKVKASIKKRGPNDQIVRRKGSYMLSIKGTQDISKGKVKFG